MTPAIIQALNQRPQQMGDEFLSNELQKALWEFMKEELSRGLEVSVEKGYAGFFAAEGEKITVKLRLDGEVISSDYVTI